MSKLKTKNYDQTGHSEYKKIGNNWKYPRNQFIQTGGPNHLYYWGKIGRIYSNIYIRDNSAKLIGGADVAALEMVNNY